MTQERKSLIRRFFGGLWALLTWLRTSLANLFFLLEFADAEELARAHEAIDLITARGYDRSKNLRERLASFLPKKP